MTTAIPTSTSVAPSPAALPVQLTNFVGREAELETLRQLLDSARLVTLTGAGGSGKTRLALESIRRTFATRRSEVAWVELASLSDSGMLARHLAVVLGVRVDGAGSTEQALLALLRDRPLLLVLDNCEHLVEECARIVDLLLRSCARLRVLTTSREALGIDGERSWLVPPLSLPADSANPSPEAVESAEAARLFVERARDVQTAFALTISNSASVARICRRLDGLPLAIELAAARINVLTAEQIAERLDDRFRLLTSRSRSALPRHRTLRAAVDWSYELLSQRERVLLERLAVFSGGFTLDAAESVCAGGEIDESELLDLLTSLATRSLVAMQEENGKARYRLLETIREYAVERLSGRSDAQTVSDRHAQYFLALARNLEPELILGRGDRLEQVDAEHDNFRAALAFSATQRAGAHYGVPLARALMWYWFHRQLWHEGFRHFETALDTALNPESEDRAAALHALGIFGLYGGSSLSRDRLSEAETIWRTTGNLRWLAFTLLCRTTEASLRKQPEEAREFATEAVAVATALGDPWVMALTTVHALVPVLIWEQNWIEAERKLVESEHAYREHDYKIGIAYVLDTRAFVALQLADHARAVSLACASLRTDPQIESRWLAGRSLRTLGAVAFAAEDLGRAAKLFGAAAGMYEAIGADPLSPERRAVNELTESLSASMPPDAFAAQWQTGFDLPFDAAIALALAAERDNKEQELELLAGSRRTAGPATSPTSGRAAVPPKFAIRALGALEIRRDGEPLSSETLRHVRPRELLLYLLSHPHGRTREQIGVDFWPDISSAQVKNNFHVTLHHLRKAIGFGDLVRYEQGRYRAETAPHVEFDAAIFEQGVSAALRSLRDTDEADETQLQLARDLEHGLSIYRGPFLVDEPFGNWQVEIRDRLARLYEDGLDALAAHHEARGENAAAATILRRLILSDSLREDAVRRLMRALTRDGRRGEALKIYERFTTELTQELGVSPEPRSEALAQRIREGAAV